jgi:putative transposase
MSIRTIALTLAPTDAQRAAFERLRRAFVDACNHTSEVAWDTRTFNMVRLRSLVYRDIRAAHGLMAQHACNAVSVVAQAYKKDKVTKRTFKPKGAVVLDTPRLYRVEGNHVAITTLDGRVRVKLNIGGIQREQLRTALKLGEADLLCDHKGRWRLMVTARYPDPPTIDTEGVIGVDLGRTDIAVTSDGDTFSGQQVAAVRDRYARTRAMIQRNASKGTRSSRRRGRAVLARLSGREHRFQRTVNHTISRRIVDTAAESKRAIAVEDLTGIRERTNKHPRSKEERRRSNSWAFYQLRAFLAYKCRAAGVPFVLVNPAFTSQMCHCCLHIGERSGKRFACLNLDCLWCGDADYNGARNIALLGRPLDAPHGSRLCCSYQPGRRALEIPRL